MQWAKVSFEKYEKMMKDFKEYKVTTNSLYDKLQKHYQEELLQMRSSVDNVNFQQRQIRDRMELMSSDFNNFEQKRGILVEKVTDLVKTTTKLGDTKLDESSAIDSFQ